MSDLDIRREGAVLHLVLNRPALRNAMSLAMVRALRAELANAGSDGMTRIVVLRGSGGHFCAGADINDLAAAREPQALAAVNAEFGHLCADYAATGLALVAVLEGSVMGGGLGLACVADVVIASDSARLALPEATLGVVPAQIAPWLAQRLGVAQARRLAITGARLDAAQALAAGLVDEVHAAGAIDSAVAAVVAQLLRCAPGAVAATKALIAKARLEAPAALIDEAAQVFAAAASGPEGREGTAAFLAKRRPAWAP